jgi:hypothetical protein
MNLQTAKMHPEIGCVKKTFLVCLLSGIYTGDKTLHVAIACSGDLKRWENFY